MELSTIDIFQPSVKPIEPLSVAGPPQAGPLDFKVVFKNALQEVNGLHTHATRQVEALATGMTNDVSGVMMAVRKADLAFNLLLQIRNKLVDAYDEINRMRM